MSNFLKGNYVLESNIIEVDDEIDNEFEKQALNSVGGSMVFVERNKMIWDGEEGIE